MASYALAQNSSGTKALSRRAQLRILVGALMLADALMLSLAFAAAYVARFQADLPFFQDAVGSDDIHVWIAALLVPFWIAIFWFSQAYNPHYLLTSAQEYKKIFSACSIAFTLVVVVTYFMPVVRVSRGWLTVACVAAIFFVMTERFVLRRVVYRLRSRGFLSARTLIVGTDEEARAIAQQIASERTSGVELLGFVDDALPVGSKIEGDLAVVGAVEALPALVAKGEVEELIISGSALSRDRVLWIFQHFGHSDEVALRFAPGLFEIYTSGVQVKEIGRVPLLSMRKFRLYGDETFAKMIIDYGIGLALLPFVGILIAVFALLIKLDSPGPLLHRRRVVGRRGRTFDALKFRTMHVNGDEILARYPELQTELARNHKLKNDPRVTRVGRILRDYSLDELPQIFNVLAGQMSLVGPRMITLDEVANYGKWRLNLMTVKPGITGFWQVSGRSDVSYEERVRLDMYYIRNYTIWLDLEILLRTIPAVLAKRGAY